MTYGRLSLLLLTKRRFSLYSLNPKTPFLHSHFFSTSQNPNPNPKPSSLSARLSFVFDQIDAIEKERSQKHQTLQRIRAWRDSKNTTQNEIPQPVIESAETVSLSNEETNTKSEATELVKKEVEFVHPWPEWIQLMERLVHQNYFDHRRKDEDKMVQDLGFDVTDVVDDDGFDFTKDFKSVHDACLNFGKDRFDLLRSLSRQDIQVLAGFGCPNVDRKVVFSGKLLRKYAHLDEGDVCSSCSLRNNCDNAYLLTNKEDEARTIDIMRMLLTFGFDPVNGPVINKPLLKNKSIKAVVRKMLHEVVKLSSVPIDPNLPPPVIKKPPPKVKQPPPTPKRRVGWDDVEMKRGDWLCPKCDFMNFAKNNVCLQCDAKRPKRQLLPGEWECPECNFLNYRRNVVCFHCECKRPPEEFLEHKTQDQKHNSGPKFNKMGSRQEVSNAWNFDFDDNESDGADVAAFEYADSHGIDKDFSSDNKTQPAGWVNNFEKNRRGQGSDDEDYANPGSSRPGTGFDDFDDEDDDIDSYELETETGISSARMESTKSKFSETEDSLDWEDSEDDDDKMHARHKTASGRTERPRSVRKNTSYSRSKDDELDFDSDEQRSILSNFKSSHVSAADQKRKSRGPTKKLSFGSESDEDVGAGLYSDDDDDLNEAYSSRQNKGNRHDSGRRNFTKDGRSGGGYKANMFSDDFDESPRQSHRNGRGGSQGNNRDRKRFEDFDESSRKSYGNGRGSQGSNRDRKSFEDFDGSSRKSYGNDRGSRGSNRDRKGFDDFDGSSRKSYGNGRGSQGSNRDRKGFDDFDGSSRKSYGNGRKSERNDRFGPSRKSYGDDRGSRGNRRSGQKFDDREHSRGQFNKYSMDEKGDGTDFRNSRRVIER